MPESRLLESYRHELVIIRQLRARMHACVCPWQILKDNVEVVVLPVLIRVTVSILQTFCNLYISASYFLKSKAWNPISLRIAEACLSKLDAGLLL